MNTSQRIAVFVAVANLLLLAAFPPYDYVSLQRGNVPTFDGFYFAFGPHPNRVLNMDFLLLEIIVVLINACIAVLLLRAPATSQARRLGGNWRQRSVLLLVAINLVLMLLFPPFEYYSAITKAALPTFEGFYFVFGDNSQRQLVTPILYIEVALVLINGALLWLAFRDKTPDELSAEQVRALAQRVRAAQKK
jgi:heme/copper-type cytochrome/quinol oxidase subunit 2